jgi:hypothetical protein
MAWNTMNRLSPSKGRALVRHSYRMIPIAYWSLSGLEARLSTTCSGAR